MNIKTKLLKLDKPLVFLVCILVIFGVLAISSATHINNGGDAHYVIMQLLWFVASLGVMFVVAFYDFRKFDDVTIDIFSIFLYVSNLISLLAVLLFGETVKGATRWINLGPLGNIQPSEFSKLIVTFCLARFLYKKRDKINNPLILLLAVIILVIPMALILKQPNLSTSLVFIIILLVQLFIAKIDYRYITSVFLISIPLLIGIIWYIQQPNQVLLHDYQKKRILALISPEKYAKQEAYQTIKSIEAIGSGKIIGKGLYQGTLNKLSYLPEPHTDFIFSVIAEEFGFLGCLFTIGILFMIISRCTLIAKDEDSLFSRLIIAGFLGIISFQVFVNIGVVSGIMPNTGLPLPFVSYGGSSLLANMVGIGMVLNIGIYTRRSFIM